MNKQKSLQHDPTTANIQNFYPTGLWFKKELQWATTVVTMFNSPFIKSGQKTLDHPQTLYAIPHKVY